MKKMPSLNIVTNYERAIDLLTQVYLNNESQGDIISNFLLEIKAIDKDGNPTKGSQPFWDAHTEIYQAYRKFFN